MEHTLRCNAMKCRKELNEFAVVTTCSHIFCRSCAEALNGQLPMCPACEARLLSPDDVVLANLKPTEGYKTSVLSGLSPTIIMECAGRALSFWAYQATQEVVYQGMMVNSLSDKYISINMQMDKIIHDANAEISDLRYKINKLVVDQENIRRANEGLGRELHKQNYKNKRTRDLYDSHKRPDISDQVQNTTLGAIDQCIQASVIGQHFLDQTPNPGRPRHLPLFTESQSNMTQPSSHRFEGFVLPPVPSLIARTGSRNDWTSQKIQESNGQLEAEQTPSSHGQRLTSTGSSRTRLGSLQTGRTAAAPLFQRQATPARAALANLSPNGVGSGIYPFAGYGMSAGIKVSNLSVAQGISSGTKATVRSRGLSHFAQRPSSTVLIEGRPPFRHVSGLDTLGQGNGYHRTV